MDEEIQEEITSEDLAPDGGFGWIIAVSMVVVFVVTTGPSSSFAIVFGEIFEATGQASSVMTLLNSVFMISFSLSGLLTTALLKKYAMRPVGVIAALFFAIPNVLSAFVTHIWDLVLICFVQGIGLGVMNNICNANFNSYWVKRRTRVMSAAHVIIGLGGIVYPITIEKFMNVYGFRGTVALTAGLSLNCIVAMMLMHPVEWHRRDPEEVRMERARLAEESRILMLERLMEEKPLAGKIVHPVLANRRSTIHAAQVFAKPSRWSSLRSLKEGGPREVPLLIETLRVRVASHSDVENGIRLRSASVTHRRHIANTISGLSASSIGNIAGVGSTYAEVPVRITEKKRKVMRKQDGNSGVAQETVEEKRVIEELGFWDMLSNLFELSLFKDRVFMTMSFGISLVFMSDYTFSSLMPLMMTELGYGTKEAALAITVSAAAELVSRILLALFTLFVNARPKTLFFIAMICMAFAKIGFFYCDDTLPGILFTVATIGMVRSWLFVPQPLVVVENFPVEKYAAAYGIFSVVSGMITIFLGPVIGIIKDVTDSFPTCQLVLIGLNCVFIIPWALDFLDERKQSKEKIEIMLKNIPDDKENPESHATH
ncbi:uncharacterized protein [Venturia canescens]|nr:uncharacterized protein LOC122406458 isoform X2 [Venturia canescens]